MTTLTNPVPLESPHSDKPTTNDKIFNLIPPQANFVRSEARYPAFVGAWGTGKTAMGIGKAVELSERYPHNLGVIFRKEYTDLKDSTLKDFEEYTGMKVDSSREVRFQNDSVIMFRHLEELNNIQNINLGWFLIEQAEELDSDEPFFKLWGRLRRKECDHKGMIIANTKGHNWIYKLWKLKTLEGGELFEANSFENEANLHPETIKSWKVLEEKKPRMYNRFIMNSWEEEDTTDNIIQSQWIVKALDRDLFLSDHKKKIVSIDVARYGDDKTIFYAIEGDNHQRAGVVDSQEWDKTSTMECVGKALIFARKYDIEAFAVDEIGVGSGVADRLSELGYQTIFVNSAKKSKDPQRFYNVRAEIYQYGADMFETEKVSIRKEDIELAEQLSWAKYREVKSNGVYLVELKDDIKKRYGRSPDNADAFLAGLWSLQFIDNEEKKDRYKRAFDRMNQVTDSDPMAV